MRLPVDVDMLLALDHLVDGSGWGGVFLAMLHSELRDMLELLLFSILEVILDDGAAKKSPGGLAVCPLGEETMRTKEESARLLFTFSTSVLRSEIGYSMVGKVRKATRLPE